jgi:Putative zinc-finger
MIMHLLGHSMNCKDATRLLSQSQDRPATFLERVRLRLHLRACELCTRFDKQLRFLREAARRYKS